MKKRGQMKLSFGMIFSIILIIIFIAFAFFGIKEFLKFQEEIKYKQFLEDLNSQTEKIYGLSKVSDPWTYSLPNKVTKICFIKNSIDSSRNLAIYTSGTNQYLEEKVQYIDLDKTLGNSDELCFPKKDGKVTLLLTKNYGENLITVKRSN